MLALPRKTKRLIMLGTDAVAIPVAFWAALALQFDRLDPSLDRPLTSTVLVTVSALWLFYLCGLYRTIIRFIELRAMMTCAVGVSLSVLIVAVFDRFVIDGHLALSALAIYWALALLYASGSRFLARYLFAQARHRAPSKPVAIYGAGDAGAKLSSVLLGGPEFKPVAFIDDKKSLQGSSINGVRVHGSEALPRLIPKHGIERILLALPSISRCRRREILAALAPLGIHVQSLPDLSDLIAGRARIDELRDVDLPDLLGRDPVPPNPHLFASCIRDKSVMVTGAGGSIGSELCRQIMRLRPARLVLLEISELGLYNVERELREIAERESLSVDIVPLLGDAGRRQRVREVLGSFGVETVYHAAAYKHVPIVEYNIVEGVHNNVVGTWHAAETAIEMGVETFVLVSTDKAVNPVNVMGATKRLAELVLQALQERTKTTRFCMVRFGNVLASSGSVVPLFQEQIRRGGPVTVTHPDVIRYFMTIPEAAQLVIQAGAMAMGGDVFVLDMGRPVRIDALARRLINLMGLTVRDAHAPDGDIAIEYIGLRPAEKLSEELLIGTNIAGTDHPMVLRAIEHHLSWARLQKLLNELLTALASSDCQRVLDLLAECVAEYRLIPKIHDRVWQRRAFLARSTHGSTPEVKVADLAAKRRLADMVVSVGAARTIHGQAPPG
ncbi:MAG: polysaccharide biosynthesis protein [Steroidobacteraceae bacterium]